MAVAYRDQSSAIGANSLDVVIDKPAATADGDALIAWFLLSNTAQTISTVPTGWTLIHSTDTADAHFFAYWKIAASEPATWTWSAAVTNQNAHGCLAFSGADGTTPINASDVTFLGTAGASVTTPSITPTVDNCMIAAVYAGDTASAGITWASTGGNEHSDVYGGSAQLTGAAYDYGTQGSAAAVSETGDSTGGNAKYVGAIYAIAPAGGAPPPAGPALWVVRSPLRPSQRG